jgi:hypothetical protein
VQPLAFYSPHRLRRVRRVWLLVWALLVSSTLVSAGGLHLGHSGGQCHSETPSDTNHLEHCQLCLMHWTGPEAPSPIPYTKPQFFWSPHIKAADALAPRWYALHNLTTGPPLAPIDT